MTEAEAREWIDRHFGAAASAKLESFVALLLEGSAHQNLIARSTMDAVWTRHIVDSAQLAMLAPPDGRWIDIGSGGGLPGVVISIIRPGRVVLIEPRRKRADFLLRVCDRLELPLVRVEARRAEVYEGDLASVISARAVASLDNLFGVAASFSDLSTTFVLPKGRSAGLELARIQKSWQGMFHVKPSVTDTDAGIIVATGVHRR